MAWWSDPTVIRLGKVIPFEFQVAVEQNVGWLHERAKIEEEIQMNNLIICEKEHACLIWND